MRYRERNLRHELKYVINQGVCEILRSRAASIMKPDVNAFSENNEYRVTSLYFDDIYRSAYCDKLNGMLNRRKYRVRAYNLSPDKITLEAKFKDGDFVSKTSAELTPEEYRKLIKGGYSLGFEEKFLSTSMEDMAVSNSVSGLTPSVLVDYFREAYVNEAGNVRLTFDKRLSTSYNSFDMFDEGTAFSQVLSGDTILEVKYDDFFPSHIGTIFSGVPLYRQSVSKFVLCADKLSEYSAWGLAY